MPSTKSYLWFYNLRDATEKLQDTNMNTALNSVDITNSSSMMMIDYLNYSITGFYYNVRPVC